GGLLVIQNTSNESERFSLEVFDMSGRRAMNERHQLDGGEKFEQPLMAGFYLARVVTDSGTVITEKILIQTGE
ncbi:MAG: T9SS type A sorting domain-containing protein, partial [Flavobacteriales bacterium]|nr:T9SS type A sorting domain-containing protein [Flavobacteriales bacterium]